MLQHRGHEGSGRPLLSLESSSVTRAIESFFESVLLLEDFDDTLLEDLTDAFPALAFAFARRGPSTPDVVVLPLALAMSTIGFDFAATLREEIVGALTGGRETFLTGAGGLNLGVAAAVFFTAVGAATTGERDALGASSGTGFALALGFRVDDEGETIGASSRYTDPDGAVAMMSDACVILIVTVPDCPPSTFLEASGSEIAGDLSALAFEDDFDETMTKVLLLVGAEEDLADDLAFNTDGGALKAKSRACFGLALKPKSRTCFGLDIDLLTNIL